MKRLLFVSILGVVLTWLPAAAFSAEITGAGATFPYPVYAKWAEAYKAKTDIGLNYQSIGSGGGIEPSVSGARPHDRGGLSERIHL